MEIGIRLRELETLAHTQLTGEEIANLLEQIDPKLKDEYNKLMDFN